MSEIRDKMMRSLIPRTTETVYNQLSALVRQNEEQIEVKSRITLGNLVMERYLSYPA